MPFLDTTNGNGVDDKSNENEFLNAVVKHVPHSTYSFEVLQDTARYLLDRTSIRPKIGIICGSGMSESEHSELCPGSIAESLTQQQIFPYEDIPHFPKSTVKGHVGQMVFGYLQDVPIMCMQGRFHYYEGYPLWKCAMPVRVMKLIGVTHLIATNAAGGLNPNYKVGDIMLVQDHLNIMGFAGNNPLQGPNDDSYVSKTAAPATGNYFADSRKFDLSFARNSTYFFFISLFYKILFHDIALLMPKGFGPRFPPMNKAYDRELLKVGQEVAEEMGLSDIVHRGVYTCLGGPSFETVAELKMLRMIGVDAVGMSTAHEVIAARHCNLTVFAFSLITNLCVFDYDCHDEANHEEVMDVGKSRQPVLEDFVRRMVQRIKAYL
ncbi:GSCOCG00007521001-RA-CDS [Cotesia congregata]|uniref:purine-nucleoside phosphorylase n=1 Tax=Cotesia congregata TaxID=51543 RepID=A0A8J2HL52_COTCN|nr:GSCOCG00007521001-RA-CDS [Cotesia congregata]CAG5101589.1 Similar to pnp: Purine nucleoside phosphorylase (Anopheles gambiae) [Cotesia congregata]